ncbi:MAG: TolC family protein [Calditrichaeota bacterium]|nr:MAG: TolC family protein [Calditrichota bacterium]MBL1207520.1 TolC family protein [Calditrichota bacterium]NOG47352.1 TolC family protein [Calditrichota bacterium]
MKLKILFITAISTFVAIQGIGQTITQQEFLDNLKKAHPYFEKENLDAQIEQEEQNSYLGRQDWLINASTSYSHDEPDIAFSGPDKTDAVSLSGGVERTFWKTGGKLTASFHTSRAEINLPPGTPFPGSFYQNKLALTYTHPLLKNKNGFQNKLQFNLKKFDIDASKVRAKENQENFLASAASKYLEWVHLSEQVKIIEERLRLNEKELQRIKKKRAANLINQIDVIRAQDVVSRWKQNLVLVESQWLGLRAELAELSQDEKIMKMQPEYNIYETVEIPSTTEAKNMLKNNSRLVQLYNTRLEQLNHSRLAFKETMKPDLSAFAQINTKNLDESMAESFIMDKPSAIVGLQFSLALDNRTAKSKIKKTDLQTMQLKKQRDDLIISLSGAAANLNVRILQLEKVLDLNQWQIKSAKERTAEEIKLYNQGRGDFTFVIQSQDNEQNAKFTYASNALTYHKLLLEYNSLMDMVYN